MGAWEKSKTKPLPYSAYAFYINRLGRNTGFKDKLTSYCSAKALQTQLIVSPTPSINYPPLTAI